ncbi:MAG: glycosyltransferase family 2 protein [Nitrospirae bacterium]|nr:glycosyltransferase family 2 protein [Nitrospirota bacterium]
MKTTLPLSVIICTFNRADYLKQVFQSLISQTLMREKYEIVVIDDGSSDNTKEVVASYIKAIPIKYFYQNNAGLASAKNHGVYASCGEILLFLDDDDIADPNLFGEHLKTHGNYPEKFYAVLGYTDWALHLNVTPLMRYVTEVGCFMFAYPYIKNGDILDYPFFWGGRSSCKRTFLIEHGVFTPVFRFGCEDIELGYRLSKHNLKVIYNNEAISYMIRPVGFDDFCKRLIKQGRSQYRFSRMYTEEEEVQKWCEMPGHEKAWEETKPIFDAKRRSALALEEIAQMKLDMGLGLDKQTETLLHQAYRWVFKACKIKGIVEAKEEHACTLASLPNSAYGSKNK